MSRVFDLLIVDDDASQVDLMRILVKELGLMHRCHHAPDGSVALAFLNQRTPFEQAPRPHLILLDLNMPEMSGCEVLRRVKADPRLRSIPVIVLSSSQEVQDVQACYREHANAYIQKPPDLEGNLHVVRELHRFWSEVACIAE